MAETDTEKEHPASGRQREKYAEEGDIARSRDLAAALAFAAAWLTFALFAPTLGSLLIRGMGNTLRNVGEGANQRLFATNITLFWQVTAPFFVASIVSAIGLGFWQNGWSLPFRPPRFRTPLVDVFSRLAQMFRLKESGVNLLVQALKMVVLGWVCGSVMLAELPRLVAHVPPSVYEGFALGSALLGTLVRRAILTYLVLGALDYWLNHYRLEQRMKMSTQELRDEAKDIHGDGRVKGRMRAMHHKLTQARSLQEVPKADVVLVNPTHYAVAVRYDETTMEAPTVLAKGADLWAERIRAAARSHGVPVISQPALARALFAKVDIGRLIPPELYQAVALVLAHVYRVRKRIP